MGRAKRFTQLDLTNAYHRLRIKEGDERNFKLKLWASNRHHSSLAPPDLVFTFWLHFPLGIPLFLGLAGYHGGCTA